MAVPAIEGGTSWGREGGREGGKKGSKGRSEDRRGKWDAVVVAVSQRR